MLKIPSKLLALTVLLSCFSKMSAAQNAFTINGKAISVESLYKNNQAEFYELEKQKFELIQKMAQQQYLDSYWLDLAKKKGVSKEVAQKNYLDSKTKLSASEIDSTVNKFKDHPQLRELSDSERKSQVVDYLKSMRTRAEIDAILQAAISKKKLVVNYPRPKEPIYKLTVNSTDPIKYGPNPTDIKPQGCKDDCPITVVEYSEFQCPFCEKVLPTVHQLMNDYKGKVRWIVRDFPLGFHKRARPAAVAAHCAKQQGKYWQMYEELFKNQRRLEDKDFEKYAQNIGIVKDDFKKFKKCIASGKMNKVIEANYKSGEKLGVTGTPAFFVNGRRLSGALPYGEFKRIFEEELKR